MKRILLIIITALLSFAICNAQKITDSGYRTIGHVKKDGTVNGQHCISSSNYRRDS